MTTQWGHIDGPPDIMAPGDRHAGGGECEAGQWGLAVDEAVIYGSLDHLRTWLQQALDAMPPLRYGKPLVTVDQNRQWRWLGENPQLYDDTETRLLVPAMLHLFSEVTKDPAAAGWILGDGVDALWTEIDTGDLAAGVTLASGLHVGIGCPLSGEDLNIRSASSLHEHMHLALALIARRINAAY